MVRKELELPPVAAKEFLKDMRAFHRAKDQLAGDKIAADAGWKLKQHLPRGTRLRLSDVVSPDEGPRVKSGAKCLTCEDEG